MIAYACFLVGAMGSGLLITYEHFYLGKAPASAKSILCMYVSNGAVGHGQAATTVGPSSSSPPSKPSHSS
jgi:hypothetical protein